MPIVISRALNFVRAAGLVTILTISVASAGEGIQWSTDIEQSLHAAAVSGKPVLMEFTAAWCIYCKRMEKSTFADANLAARVNAQFVPLQIDADQNRDLVKKLDIKGLPAVLIISSDLTVIERISGFQTAEALSSRLDRVVSAAQPQKLPHQPHQPQQSSSASDAGPPRSGSPVASAAEIPGRASFQTEPPAGRASLSRPAAAAAEPEFVDLSESIQPDTAFDPVRTVSQSQPRIAPAMDSMVAFEGICIVSAVDDREIMPGSPLVQGTYRGKTVNFLSDMHKANFLADPDRYWPMLDGACPVTLAEEHRKIPGDFQFAVVFRRRIWLFTSEDKMHRFLQEPADIVEAALEQL